MVQGNLTPGREREEVRDNLEQPGEGGWPEKGELKVSFSGGGRLSVKITQMKQQQKKQNVGEKTRNSGLGKGKKALKTPFYFNFIYYSHNGRWKGIQNSS